MKKIISAAIFVFLMNTVLFASYKEALKLYESKKYIDSLKLIANILDIKKDMEKGSPNYKLRFLAAHNHWKLGNFRNAIIHLKRCNVIKKEISDPLIDLSLMMLDFKRYGDARFFAKKALKIEENPAAYFVLGKSAMKYRNYFKAKGYFEKSISLDPEYGISYNALGITLMRLKKYSEANTAFSAAMATMVSSAEVMNNIGFSLEKKGNNDEALVYYSKAVSKNPENKVMQKNIKRIKEKIKEVK